MNKILIGLGILLLSISYFSFEKKPDGDNAIILAKKYAQDYGHQDAWGFKHLSTYKIDDNHWKQIVFYRIQSLKCEVIIDVDYNKNDSMWYGRRYSYSCK